jgi:elongation factor Ts
MKTRQKKLLIKIQTKKIAKGKQMSIDAKLVKTLRERTGAGMMDCKKALMEVDGDLDLAVDQLRKAGIAKAEKKSSRAANEGVVFSYIHHGNKLGVLVEVGCETDFVAKTEGFNELASSIAMQVAASNPLAVDESGISKEILDREKEIFVDQAKSSGKPDNVVEKIVEGKLNKFIQDNCLMHQSFVKNPDVTISQLVQEAVAKLGENITVNRFVRFALGEQLN